MHCKRSAVQKSAQPQCNGIEIAQVLVANPVLKGHFNPISLQLSSTQHTLVFTVERTQCSELEDPHVSET